MTPWPRLLRALPSVVGVVSVVLIAVTSARAGASASAGPHTHGTAVGSTSAVSEPAATSPSVPTEASIGEDSVPLGFPSGLTTGVLAGTPLTTYAGNMRLDIPGTVINDVLIRGCLVVQADDVTIRNSKIVCKEARPAIAMLGSSEGTVVSHVEVDGANVATIGIELKNGVASDINVYGAGDGVHLGSDATLEDSYIHDLGVQPNLHHDDLQTAKGSQASHIRVIHNTLLAYTSSKGDNSVYHVGSGAISDVLLEDNYIDGGHYSIEDTNEVGQRDIVIRGNHFGRHYHYGIILVGARNDAVSVVGNVWQDDGEPATEANSLGKGQATSNVRGGHSGRRSNGHRPDTRRGAAP